MSMSGRTTNTCTFDDSAKKRNLSLVKSEHVHVHLYMYVRLLAEIQRLIHTAKSNACKCSETITYLEC